MVIWGPTISFCYFFNPDMVNSPHAFFSKERNVLAFFCVLFKRTRRYLRSFAFFIKECGVLCVLLRSLKKNAAFFAFFCVLYNSIITTVPCTVVIILVWKLFYVDFWQKLFRSTWWCFFISRYKKLSLKYNTYSTYTGVIRICCIWLLVCSENCL